MVIRKNTRATSFYKRHGLIMTGVELFREKPMRWGLRGDPYLWDGLEQSFKEIALPYGEECFLEKIYSSIEEITGQRLEEGEDIDVEIFEHRGLSGGKISYKFWTNTAIPLLVSRLNQANKEIQDKYNYEKIINFSKIQEEEKEDYIQAHKYSANHKAKLEKDKICGCFYCLNIFSLQEINQWVSTEETAICLYCSVDSVIGDSSGYPVTKEFLTKMKEYWF